MHTQAMIRQAFSPRVFAGGMGELGQTPGREQVEEQFWREYGARTTTGVRAKCEYPDWCDWIGGMDRFFDACKPLTPEELRACQAADIGPAMPPEMKELALKRGDEGVAAYCRMHPVECAAYKKDLEDPNRELKNLGWIAAGVGVLILVLVIGRR